MTKCISKQVLSYQPQSILEDDYFKRIRERLWNQDPHYQKEDTNPTKDKKNVLSPTGFGSRWRENNPGAGMNTGYEKEEEPRRGIGSGYNDGGPIDDEIGPGNTSVTPDPYVENQLFMDLKLMQGKRDQARRHLKGLVNAPSVVIPHKRYSVDQLSRS